MTIIKFIFYLFNFFVILSCTSKSQKKITIAASANMQYVLKELISEFSNDNLVACEIVLGSSGKLTAQIEAGAPFDIFLSANAKYPLYLKSKNNSYTAPKTYAYGKLAVLSKYLKTTNISELLTSTEVKKIAIPNPKNAPYGQMAEEYLMNLDIYPKIKHKLVYGESVMQSNQFVISGAADVGFTAISTLKTKNSIHFKHTIINDRLYTPIPQQLLILTPNSKTQQFAHFMLSKKAQDILKKYGYGSIE